MNIPQSFEEVAKKNPKSIVLEQDDRTYSYEEILSSAKSIASYLSNRGVNKADRVSILLEGRPEWGIVYLGISFLGAVSVPIDIQLGAEEVSNLLGDSESKAIFISEKTLKSYEDAVKILFSNPPPPPFSKAGNGRGFSKGGGSEEFTKGGNSRKFGKHAHSEEFSKGGTEGDFGRKENENGSNEGSSSPHPRLSKGGQEGGSYQGMEEKQVMSAQFSIEAINIDSTEFVGIMKHPHLNSFPSVGPDDIASLIYTSGTTGRPKGVVLTHGNFLSNVKSIQGAKIIDERDCLLSILPLHHSYPFMINFLFALLSGARVVYLQSLKGPDILKTISEKDVTALVGVPQLFAMFRRGIIDGIGKTPPPFKWIVLSLMELSGIMRSKLGINPGKIIFSKIHKRFGRRFRFFVSGGAKLDPKVSQDLEALGFTILEGYGLTETSPVVSFNPPGRIKRGSVGLPLPEVEIKILRPNEEGTGEIAVRGPNVMKGYYRKQEETDKVVKDGWFLTGDIGHIDKDGYLYITGRSKEVIVLSSGKNIYPEEIEKHYLQSQLIKEICVFGEGRTPGIADTLKAVIVPNIEYMKEENIANFNEAVKWQINSLSMKLPSYKRIMGYEVYQHALPKTTLGKLKRYVIKDIISGKVAEKEVELSDEEREILDNPAGRRVIASLERIVEKRPIRLDHNLELDLGIDSMARVELLVSLSRALSIELPDTFMTDIHNVKDMIHRVEEYQTGAGKEVGGVPKEWKEFFKTEPSAEDQRAVGLIQDPITTFFTIFALSLLKIIGKFLFRLEVKGIENIPTLPYIVAPNHASNIDGFMVGTVVPAKTYMSLYFLGFQKYFSNWFTSRFARLAHVIPIDPDMHLKRALLISGYVLREGKAICLFPEGGRTFDGKLLPFKKGVGILSKELHVPLVPTLIEGTFEVLPRDAIRPKLRKIKVTFGKPIYPKEIDFSGKPSGMDDYEWIVAKLREVILQMKG
jgi:long-chain acyl-CoA synthetase